MSSTCEQQYRKTLSWYPKKWRTQNEETVLGTLLDLAESENRTKPLVAERINLAWNGVATRVGLILPASVRDGVAGVALVTGAAYSAVSAFFSGGAPFQRFGSFSSHEFDPFESLGIILCGLWMLGFIFAALKLYWVTRVLLGISILVAITIFLVNILPSMHDLFFLAMLAIFSMIGVPRSRLRLSAGAVTALLFFSTHFYYHGGGAFFEWGTIFFWPPIPTQIPIMYTLTPALIIVLTVAGALRMANRITLSSIIAFSTIPWAAFWLNIAVVDLPYGRTNEMLISLTGIVLVAAFVFLQQKFEIIIRPRQTEPEQSDHPFSGRTDLSHTQSIIKMAELPSRGLKASPPD